MFIFFIWIQLTYIISVNAYKYPFYRVNLSLQLSSYKENEKLNGKGNDRRKSRSTRPNSDMSEMSSSLSNVRKASSSASRQNDGIRQARISRSIRDELAEIICEGDIKATSYPEDDLLKSTCITDVDISPDLAYAKIFISVIGNSVQRRQVFVWLCENSGQVRYELAKRLKHMKRLPEIIFKLSDNKESSDLLSLIDQVTLKEKASTTVISDDDDDDDEYEVVEEEK